LAGYLYNLKKHIPILSPFYKEKFDINLEECFKKAKNHTEFDEMVTIKVNGFKNLDEYYHRTSSYYEIPHIKTPTFMMMAEDDPILGINQIDYKHFLSNPNILLGVTSNGGHLGYAESIYSTRQWFVEPIFEFLSAYLD